MLLQSLAPGAEVTGDYFPKIFAGEYGSEISALLVSGAQLVNSSFWGGDLESFLFQSIARGLPQRMPFVLTSGEPLVARVGDKIPDGTIIGARGPHADLAPDNALNAWLKKVYKDRYGEDVTYPVYYMTMAILGPKVAYDKAGAAAGGKPSEDQVIAAFENIEYETPSGPIASTLGGAITAPKISVTPSIGIKVIVVSFAVVAIGGMGTIGGNLLGALLVGLPVRRRCTCCRKSSSS